jgi:hypothetical protein
VEFAFKYEMSKVSQDKHNRPARENRRIILIWRTINVCCPYIFLLSERKKQMKKTIGKRPQLILSSSDPDGSSNTTGPDNYAIGKNQGEGLISDTQTGLFIWLGTTDSSGKANATFVVSRQPGDNFKIAASADYDQVNKTSNGGQMTQTIADTGQNLPAGVKLSPILEVWRTLWIKQDSMDQVATSGSEKNYITDSVQSYGTYQPSPSDYTWIFGNNTFMYDNFAGAPYLNTDQYAGGKVIFDTSGLSYNVRASEYSLVEANPYPIYRHHLKLQGNPASNNAVNASFKLYDDDDQTLLNSNHYCSVGSYASAFSNICIDVEEQTGEEVDFELFVDDVELSTGLGSWNNGTDLTSSSDFWACTVVACYQQRSDCDVDPDEVESAILGVSPSNCNIATIYIETIKDLNSLPEAFYVAHEIGHTGGANHGTTIAHWDYIMGQDDDGVWSADFNADTFHPDDIVIFRSHETWSSSN